MEDRKIVIFQVKLKTHQNIICTICKIYNVNNNKIADIYIVFIITATPRLTLLMGSLTHK